MDQLAMNDSEVIRNLDVRSIIEFFRSENYEGLSSKSLYSALLELMQNINLTSFRAIAAFGTKKLRTELRSVSAERDFNRLVELGLKEETLFIALLIFRFLPNVDYTLRTLLGEMKDRRRKAKILRDAASVMDEFARLTETEARSMAGKLCSDQAFSTPLKTADSLHVYANLLFVREQLLGALNANSAEEIAKYTLASAYTAVP